MYTKSAKLELSLFDALQMEIIFECLGCAFSRSTKCHDLLQLCSSGSKRPAQ